MVAPLPLRSYSINDTTIDVASLRINEEKGTSQFLDTINFLKDKILVNSLLKSKNADYELSQKIWLSHFIVGKCCLDTVLVLVLAECKTAILSLYAYSITFICNSICRSRLSQDRPPLPSSIRQ